MDTDLAQRARTVLDTERYLVVGTVDPDGVPRVSPVFFTHDRYRDLYWVSRPDTHHSTNLATWPWVSAVVYDSGSPVGEGRAVYVTGRALRGARRRAGAGLRAAFAGVGPGRPRVHAGGAVRAGDAAALPRCGSPATRCTSPPATRRTARGGPPRRRGSLVLTVEPWAGDRPDVRRPLRSRVLRVASSWVWDFWLADDGDQFHLFFLKAPRDLARTTGTGTRSSGTRSRATSPTGSRWPTRSTPSAGPAFDDLAIWTGSVVRDGAGWRMFYTGIDRADRGRVQRIGAAVSDDLMTWTRVSAEPVLVGRPAVVRHRRVRLPRSSGATRGCTPTGRRRLAPARDRPGRRGAARGRRRDRARHLAGPAHLDGAAAAEPAGRRLRPARGAAGRGRRRPAGAAVRLHDRRARPRAPGARGSGAASGRSSSTTSTGPYDVGRAHLLHDESLYVGKLVRRRDGDWCLLAFRNVTPDGFGGEITDPVPVRWGADGRLALDP